MAAAMPPGQEKETWCQEKLDFVCAVVNNVDRDTLRIQLEICETEDEAEALLQSLLWLQDAQQATGEDPGGAAGGAAAVAYNPGVNDGQVDRPMPGAPTLEPAVVGLESFGLPGIFDEEFLDPVTQTSDSSPSGGIFYEDRVGVVVHANDDDSFVRQVLGRNTTEVVGDNGKTLEMSEEDRNSPRQNEPSDENIDVVDSSRGSDSLVSAQESGDDWEVSGAGKESLADEQENTGDNREMQNDNGSRMPDTDEVAENNTRQVLDDRYTTTNTDEEAAYSSGSDENRGRTVMNKGDDERGDGGVAGAVDNDANGGDVLQSDYAASNENRDKRSVSIEEADYVVVDIEDGKINTRDEHQETGSAENRCGRSAVIPGTCEGQVSAENNGGRIKSDDAGVDSEEDDISIIGVVSGPHVVAEKTLSDESDDNQIQFAENQEQEHSKPIPVEDEEADDESWFDPLQENQSSEEEYEEEQLPDDSNAAQGTQDDVNSDEHLARRVLEAMDREERERLEADERLARKIAEEMAREECLQEAQDERFARQLADEEAEGAREEDDDHAQEGEMATDSETEDTSQGTIDDEVIARELAEEGAVGGLEDTSGDEELARRLDEEEHQNLQTPPTDDSKSGQLAQLMSIFPDADPHYLRERCDGSVKFDQLVDELIELQKSNPKDPRISGHLKRQQEARAESAKRLRTVGPMPQGSQHGYEEGATGSGVFQCSICFEENIPAQHKATCNNLNIYHYFCIECVRKYVGAQIELGKNVFKCMEGYCKAEFSLVTLARVMEPVVLQKVQERRQQEEVESAGIEDLVACPFCNFMVIMPDPHNRVLECLNPECLKESCRLCQRPSHIPQRCEEVEYDNQKDARVHIENKMSEAMIRTCPNCKKSIVSVGGCNKMTCPCGTVMCYVCKQAIVNSYDHFSQGRCPQSSNLDDLHTNNVRQAATQARQELDPEVTLVHDPTEGIL